MTFPGRLFAAWIIACSALSAAAKADAMLSDFAYPHEVRQHAFTSQGQALSMAYMDIAPEQPSGRAIFLLHGKNFCGATWDSVIRPLVAQGYRVVVPDQIGFCKSTKPDAYQFTLHELAANTRGLADALGIEKPIVIGHSMGGMLAVRYALSFPDGVSALVLVNPIGLEDWRAKGVPSRTVDALFATEKATDAAKIKGYQQSVYYDGAWKPDYDRWVEMLASIYAGPDGARVAWNQALTSAMVFSEPVVHEFERIAVPHC